MIDLSYLHAIILGVVQGLTEFLPVSSSAHLALTQKLLGIDPSSGTVLLFDLLTHIGTLVAMAVVFGSTVQRYFVRLVAEIRPGWNGNRAAWRFLWLGVLASIPTGVIGLAFKRLFEDSFSRPRQIGVELCVTGVLLGITARLARGRIGWRRLAAWHGLVVGFAQALAILPGVSRSGATICTATYCGIRRRWAADFSFLIAVPAILGATALKLKDAGEQLGGAWGELPWGPMVVGSIASAVVGAIALAWLLRVVRRAQLHWFAPYCFLVGMLAIKGVFSDPEPVGVQTHRDVSPSSARGASTDRAIDPTAAEEHVAVVEHHRLAGRDGALGNVEAYLGRAVAGESNIPERGGMQISNLDLRAEAGGVDVGQQIDPRCDQPGSEKSVIVVERNGV